MGLHRWLPNVKRIGFVIFMATLFLFPLESILAQQGEVAYKMTSTMLQEKFYKTQIDQKIDVEIQEATVEDALRQIANRTGLKLTYRGDVMEKKEITLMEQEVSVTDALDSILNGTELDYKFSEDGYLLIYASREDLTEIEFQQTVTGTVTDAQTGEPLPGVNVIVAGSQEATGSTIGTTTEMDGQYNISVPDELNILVFSFVGYQRTEVAVDGRNVIDVELEPERIRGDELVVVGYGVQRRSEVTGSVGIVSGEDLQEQQSSFNALQSLRGKVPGVNIYTNSGSPSGSNRVIIRGISTINASSDPLYVVDGVQREDIDNMNPNDIESIEVLKDASATAIYGARGANGVVMITTERGGTEDDGVQVEYNGNLNIGWLANKMDAMNAEEFMEVQRIGFENAPLFDNYTPGNEPKLDNLSKSPLFDDQGNPIYDTDWQEEATRTSISQDHQLDIRTGGENYSFGAYLNYTDQEGILLDSYNQRANVRVVYDANPTNWLEIGSNLSVTRTWESLVEESGGGQFVRRLLIEYPPIFPVKYDNGSWTNSTQTGHEDLTLEGQPNPVHRLLGEDRLRNNSQLFGNTYATFKITPNLLLRTQLGINSNQAEFRYYAPSNMIGGGFPDGRSSISNSEANFWQNENYLTYQNDFGPHRLNSVLGASWQQKIFRNHSLNARSFPNDKFRFNNIDAAANFDPPSSGKWDWTMNSYFTRTSYSYDNRYTVTVTGRVDGSSRFGENNKYGFFPSAGISWMVSNEKFMSNISTIDQLRLRTSYGITGNTEIGVFQSIATIGSGTTLKGGQRLTSSYVQRLANPDLEWEKTKQFDVGLELVLFNQTVSLEADYYYKLTEDLLLERPVPTTTGFSSILDNIGSISNRGIDFQITTYNLRRSDLFWSSTLNFNYNQNRVEALGANDEDIFPGPFWVGGSQTILRVGEPVSSYWGFERLGTWNTDEAAEAAEAGKIPGMVKRSDNEKILGNGLPDWTGSLINKFNFGNFDATIDLQFVYGVDVMQQFVVTAEDRQALTNGLATQLYDAWTPDNQNTMQPRIRHTPLSGQDLAKDSNMIADGSYLRGNLFALGYTFGQDITNSLGVNQLRINASIENAFVLTSDGFIGYDPEASSWPGDKFGQNIFFYQYPKPRTFSLGLSFQF
ncbi:MAG: SusC/RagA family TonB-linked outer membrane protein [Bacteroidetes bacterium]|jgi:TonB-linked SusC/RagA family outer membrane protein|nr:SusC/RagA family TonB-linked outer membrane protein [Bacteroidota bacterium]